MTADVNFFLPLLRKTIERGWNLRMVAADKGYHDEQNYTIPVREMGIKVFIPFKRGIVASGKSEEMLEMLTLYEQFPDEFDDPYNAVRPKIEGVFSATKRTTGNFLWSRGPSIPENANDSQLTDVGFSRRNELMAKFIIHSLRQIVMLECIHDEMVDFKNDRAFTPIKEEGQILEEARQEMSAVTEEIDQGPEETGDSAQA